MTAFYLTKVSLIFLITKSTGTKSFQKRTAGPILLYFTVKLTIGPVKGFIYFGGSTFKLPKGNRPWKKLNILFNHFRVLSEDYRVVLLLLKYD